MKIFSGDMEKYTEREWLLFIEIMYKDSDKAHDEKHIKDVWSKARKMCDFTGNRFNHIIKAAVAFHDITAKKDRENHNISGAEYFLKRSEGCMNNDDREVVANCIREHRSSYSGKYSHEYSEILASADRDAPSDVKSMVERSYKYARTKENKSPELSVKHCVAHIKEKYGRNGTAKYPELYKRFYKNEVNRMYKKIDDITEEEYSYLIDKDAEILGRA